MTFTLSDLGGMAESRSRRKREVFSTILNDAFKRVNRQFEAGGNATIFEVPVMIAGVPSYPLGEAIEFVCDNMINHGFAATQVGTSNQILLYWEVKPQKAKPVREPKKKVTFEPFDDIHKLANQYKAKH